MVTEQYRVQPEKVVSESIDNEVIIIHLETGNYYTLKGIGAFVWALLHQPRPSEYLTQYLSTRYQDKPHEEISADITAFLADLRREDLIVAAPDTEAEISD